MNSDTAHATTSPEVDAIVQVSFAVQAVLTRGAAEFDLSVTQLRLLGILRDRTPTMAELASHLGLDRSSVSGLIDRAERRALVTRIPSADDARVINVGLTPAGVDLAERLAASVGEAVEALLDGVNATERARLVRLADTIMRSARG